MGDDLFPGGPGLAIDVKAGIELDSGAFRDGGRIRVTIQDNGIGFRLREARPTSDGRGLGLVGCAQRLARVGGMFDIRSAPNRGTLVILEAPRA